MVWVRFPPDLDEVPFVITSTRLHLWRNINYVVTSENDRFVFRFLFIVECFICLLENEVHMGNIISIEDATVFIAVSKFDDDTAV